jgi:serine O-acetyltransferase
MNGRDNPESPELARLVEAMLASYRRDPRAQHVNRRFLPSREEILEIVGLLFQLFYPGYHGRQDLTDENLPYHVGNLLSELREKLARQIETCLCFTREMEGESAADCSEAAGRAAGELLARLPAIRDALVLDAQAAYDGDPAAQSLDEVILAYPGFLAVTVHRVAHELHRLGVPLMPRIMSEWAHTQSGADIHPGATIGESFFVDHATGVVVGETTEIGARVKLYQGVTLGALSHPRDEAGRVVRDTKRHPTVEDDATLYANAIVLGGGTVVGAESVVGGSVFLTRSVPPRSRVGMKPPELSLRVPAPPGAEFEI